MSLIKLNEINKNYNTKLGEVTALGDISFEIDRGEFVVVVGKEGSGKTTLLSLIGGMDKADLGEIKFGGKYIGDMTDSEIVEYRRNEIGFAFEGATLIEEMTAQENIELASSVCKNCFSAQKMLSTFGLDSKKDMPLKKLSDNEKRRVAIAVALSKNPTVLLLDEPLRDLGEKMSKQLLAILHSACRATGMTVIVTTDNPLYASVADRAITLDGGKLVSAKQNKKALEIEKL